MGGGTSGFFLKEQKDVTYQYQDKGCIKMENILINVEEKWDILVKKNIVMTL